MTREIIFAAICLLTTASAWAQSAPTGTPTILNVSQIFVPPGFDNNDNVQVILRSNVPNTCYKISNPISHVDLATQTIYVAAQGFRTAGEFCGEIFIVFNQTVNLGRLPSGDYKVVQIKPDGTEGTQAELTVATAKPTWTEDNLYASVDQAFVDTSTGTPVVRLVGTLPSPCFAMQEIHVLHRAAHIVEVLPVMAPVTTQDQMASCSGKPVPFDVTETLPAVEPGAWLLYTRSINGQSLVNVQAF
ncbi:MAG: hypothetical protein P4M08_13295 [Oligoflexia bacterium]|nr:hypothetical protein [Oligoflexia bacterium]